MFVLFDERIAFAELFDDEFAISKQLDFVLRQTIPKHILVDSKNLFDIISKESRTSEKRIMLDTYVSREACKAQEISNLGFVRSLDSKAAGLTEYKVQKAL